MLRRSVLALHGLVPYHEWNLREPLLQKYEGWRILDNPKMTKWECWLEDFGGSVRHLDPIIDDPRLTHRQRVCRLYKWALKELKSYTTFENQAKFNLAYKVVRNRFEKYRYVTDPAMCDMMVRETQKYLRETANPAFMRYNATSPNAVLTGYQPMYYPDHAQCYDHWTQPETLWYDDAKMHRYGGHHPCTSAGGEMTERFGEDKEFRYFWRKFFLPFAVAYYFYHLLWFTGFFHQEHESDPMFYEMTKHFNQNVRSVIEAEERNQRSKYASSQMTHDWDLVMGFATQKVGYFVQGAMQRFRQPDALVSPPI